jgi:hypothetical protein
MHLAYANHYLYIDGEPHSTYDGSSREIFLVGNDLILKVERNFPGNQCQGEAYFLSNLTGRDRMYFPALYASGVMVDESTRGWPEKEGVAWVLVERIRFSQRNHTLREIGIVQRLVNRYKIEDIYWSESEQGSYAKPFSVDDRNNWEINAATDKPVIYDIGLHSVNKHDWMDR